MPTYQYRCTQCGNQLEIVQKFTDPALTQCDRCDGALRKVYNAVGVVFKGSGFYRTDSRAGADGKKTSSGGSAAKDEKTTAGEKAASGDSGSKGSNGSNASSPASSSEGSSAKKPAAASSTAA